MIARIPLTNDANYVQRVTLGGESYTLRVLWNERRRRWFLSLEDSSGASVFEGVKVVADIPIRSHLLGGPDGQLWTLDTSGQGADPELLDLGERVLLLYAE